jgi:hypothetical protein
MQDPKQSPLFSIEFVVEFARITELSIPLKLVKPLAGIFIIISGVEILTGLEKPKYSARDAPKLVIQETGVAMLDNRGMPDKESAT